LVAAAVMATKPSHTTSRSPTSNDEKRRAGAGFGGILFNGAVGITAATAARNPSYEAYP
jgi:hypothetical protein